MKTARCIFLASLTAYSWFDGHFDLEWPLRTLWYVPTKSNMYHVEDKIISKILIPSTWVINPTITRFMIKFVVSSQSSKVIKTLWIYARWGVKPNWDVFHTIWIAYWIIWHLLYDGTYAFICIIALKFDQFMPSAWGRTHLLVSSKYNNWTPRNLNSCLNIFPSISYPHRSTVTSFSGITGWK